jgi:hypothetical protein
LQDERLRIIASGCVLLSVFQRAVVTASKTRKKHHQELIHTALMAEETSKRAARENFTMSTVPMLQLASFEPLLHQPREEEEEGV